MHGALISVIIPMYNNKDTIRRTIASVFSQSYSNFEVIVVDDGSNDGGDEIVRQITDKRLHLFRLPHHNANVARNYGIRQSRGEYIAMLDADDEWKKNHLTLSLQTLLQEKADGVYGSLILHNGKEEHQFTTRPVKEEESTIDFLLSCGYGAQTSTLFMTATSAKAVLWDETLKRHQDYDFLVRYFRKYRMRPKLEATTIYHSSNVSTSIDFDSCIRFIHTVEQEITDQLYLKYHLHMLKLAIALSAYEDIIRHYRKESTRNEYLLSLHDYLLIRNPKGKMETLFCKIKYIWNISKH